MHIIQVKTSPVTYDHTEDKLGIPSALPYISPRSVDCSWVGDHQRIPECCMFISTLFFLILKIFGHHLPIHKLLDVSIALLDRGWSWLSV